MMRVLFLIVALLATGAAAAESTDVTLLRDLDVDLTQAREQQMPLLAPDAWAKVMDASTDAHKDFDKHRSLKTIQKSVDQANAALASARETMRLGRVTFETVLTSRASALSAGADKSAVKLWADGEEQFHNAATSLEHGRSDKAQALAAKAAESYRSAELEAIQGAILRDARSLLAQADAEKVEKFAPQTLANSRALLAEAERALVEDRYDTDRPRSLAKQAKEQASHALHLTAVIKAINSGDHAPEDVLLASETPVVNIANEVDVTPDLSNGVASTAAETLSAVDSNKRELARLKLELAERDERIRALETSLGGASREAVALNSLLAEQQERRDQLAQVEQMFALNEAEVLRSGNAIILRLVGLSFDSGSAVILTSHFGLLTKVQDALKNFPDSVITVEGHTDSFGSDETNLELSQRRADAVRSFLLSQTDIAPYRISAMGYGEARPIASNETAEGRARNRRIDLVITRSGD
jgi:outer membrane protein OmpA-like peptidoglycan-associated protein